MVCNYYWVECKGEDMACFLTELYIIVLTALWVAQPCWCPGAQVLSGWRDHHQAGMLLLALWCDPLLHLLCLCYCIGWCCWCILHSGGWHSEDIKSGSGKEHLLSVYNAFYLALSLYDYRMIPPPVCSSVCAPQDNTLEVCVLWYKCVCVYVCLYLCICVCMY